MSELPQTMSAVVNTPAGDARTTRSDVPLPETAPDEALVAVEAFAVNRGELTLLRIRDEGWIPGQDVAGTVVRPAADGSGPAPRTRVAGLAEWNGWAEYAAVPTRRIAVLPEGVTAAQGAALPMAGTTALGTLAHKIGDGLQGSRVAITGASGGVGRIAVQLAHLGGADVTAVAVHGDGLAELGANQVVEELGDADAGEGFDLIVESAGGASLDTAFEKVAHEGTIVVVGNSAQEPASYDFRGFAGREAIVRTYFSGRHEAKAGKRLEKLIQLVADGKLDPGVGLETSWDDLNGALDALERREVPGKVVLTT